MKKIRNAFIVLFSFCISSSAAYASGITIPSGSSLNINTGILNVAGDINNSGTLVLTTGTITLTGNWINSGTFTAGTGTVDFTAGDGITQTLNSGGTGAGKLFYNLTHSGAGTLKLVTNPIDIDGNFTNSAGTFDANGLNISCAGNWSNSGTFNSGNNTVTFDGTDQKVSGSNTFYNLKKTASAAETLTFQDTAAQTIENNLTLQGKSGSLLSLRSTSSGNKYNLTLKPGGTQNLSYLDVQDSDASGGITLVASTSENSGNNPNWAFDGVTITYDGSDSTDWDTPSNWDLGLVPRASDTVIIAETSTHNQPVLGSNTTVANLTINSGCSLNLNGKNLTVSGTFTNEGSLQLFGSETVSIGTMDTDSGTVVYTGNGDTVPDTFTLADFGGADYYNLIINDTHTVKDIFQTNAGLTVNGALQISSGTLDISTNANTLTTAGDLTIDGGTLNAAQGNIDANGSLILSSGVLTAPGPGKSFTLAGSFSHSGGTFTHSSGTLTLDGPAAATISGNTSFYNLECTTPGKQLNFTAGTTQTVNNTLTLTGASGNLITLRSTQAGSKWDITFPNGPQTVSYIDVKDADANTNIVTCYNSVDSGNNNANWVFNAVGITSPIAGKTVDTTPTIIGVAGPNDTVVIKDKDGTAVATTTADANGNFRIEIPASLAAGSNSLTPYVGSIAGVPVSVTVAVNPTTDQVPVINSPAEGQRILGAKPTITGKGLAGQSVRIEANDADGNLPLQEVGSGTVDASGNYSVVLTTSLPKGKNYLTVTVDGVTSDIRTVQLTDPYGVVFDSVSNNPIQGAKVTLYYDNDPGPGRKWIKAVPGVQIDAGDSNPQTTASDGVYSFFTINGDFKIAVSASGYNYPSVKTSFPAGRTIVTGSKGEPFTVAGAVIEMDQPMDASALLLKIKKDANKKEVSVGDVVTYTITIKNETSSDVTDVYLKDKIPAGFKYLSGKVILDGNPISDPQGSRPLLFHIGTVKSGTTRILKYQLVVGSGVTFGNYENIAKASYANGIVISNEASETVKVVPEPLFDLGTIIGKVFWDRNENGIQDNKVQSRRSKVVSRKSKVEGGEKDAISIRKIGSVAAGNGPDRKNLQNNEGFPGQGTIRGNITTAEGGSINTTEHRGGPGTLSQQGIHSVPLSSQRFSIRSDDTSESGGSASVSYGGRSRKSTESMQRDSRKNPQANRLNEKMTSDIRPTTLDVGHSTYDVGHTTYDKQESGIPDVRIVMEDGTVITTDKDGKFHLAAVIPGRHVLRLDESTLPEGAYLTTDKAVIVDVTPGMLFKVNFGVNSKISPQNKESSSRIRQVKIVQERGRPRPRLNVAYYPFDVQRQTSNVESPRPEAETLDVGPSTSNIGHPAPPGIYEFRIFTNYALFIKNWRLEILDKDTRQIVKVFRGTKGNIFEPILWDGKTEDGGQITEDRNYSYRLIVFGAGGRRDVTKEKTLDAESPTSNVQRRTSDAKTSNYQEWLLKESRLNNLDNQAIKIEGETILVMLDVRDKNPPASNNKYYIRILKSGKLEEEIPVTESKGLTARDLLENKPGREPDKQTKVEIILPKGGYDIEVVPGRLDVKDKNLPSSIFQPSTSNVRGRTLDKGEENGVSIRKIGSVAAENGPDREKLQNNEGFSGQGTIRGNITTAEGGSVNTTEHRGGPGTLSQQGIHSVPLSSQRFSIRSDGTSESGGSASVSYGGRIRKSASNIIYKQHIKVGNDYLFFVAMGDAEMGYTKMRGHIEPVQHNDRFREGFWSKGKLSYYLKGKIKGKYLITSSLDTDRQRKALFRHLDPNKYYPVYGDASVVNYDATNTQGMLYLLIEWDKSSVLWGNYNTGFNGTEFAQFNRTLYGGKVHLESVSTTRFGEPSTKLVVFRARAKQRAAHNEFVGTGGSLFYLKHKDIVEGSEKVKIEVRDKITGLVLTTKDMEEGPDYEIDYSNGRIIFWQPVSYIVKSDSIISSHLLEGNPVYVVVDYEYQTKDKYDEGTYGLRAQQSLGDYLRVGGTYVREEQLNKNYELKGTDTIIHLGRNAKLTAEYAQSKSEEVNNFISTDGGLSFTELPTADTDEGRAYGIKGEANFFGKLGLRSYYKRIEKGFSSTATVSQQGKELAGLAATYDLTLQTRLKASYDIQKLIDEGNAQTQLQTGAEKTQTVSAQVIHSGRKLRLTGEYRHQEVSGRKEKFESETNAKEDVLAVQADYKLTPKTTLSLKQQAAFRGKANNQTTLAAETKVNDNLTLKAKETMDTQGTASSVGAAVNVKDRLELSSDYTRTNYRTGEVGSTASFSGKASLDEKTKVYTTVAVTDSSSSGSSQSLVFGTERKLNKELTLATSKTYAKSRDKLTRADTFSLTREREGRKLEGTFTRQQAQSSTEVSNTNIFGLSGDINDKWSARGSFERGIVQNHNGTQTTRNTLSLGVGYVDKDPLTGASRLKASGKLELRSDRGEEDQRQYLVYSAVEGKINPDTTLFTNLNYSQTKNTTLGSTMAQYKEFVLGLAYRPVNFDRLNLLAKYTYLEDNSPSGQSSFSDIEGEKSHTLAGEAIYDLTDRWQISEKLAYKMGEEKVTGFDFTKTSTWLNITRLNYKIGEDWQVGVEYRRLTQKQAEDYKQGALVEVSRKISDFVQVGAGYNFTDFNDDLTHLDYTAQGPFIRLTGKFYDRTPEEIERARQRRLETMIKLWAWELVNKELAKPDNPVSKELYRCYYFAKKFKEEGRLNKAKKYYQKSLEIGKMMYAQAEEYVRGRIELEKELKELNMLALEYYRQGRLLKARQLWRKIKTEAEPKPIVMEVQRWVIR